MSRRTIFPLIALASIAVISFLGPFILQSDPMATSPAEQLAPPSLGAPLGTDYLGRDVLSRLVHGGRRTLLIALGATTLAVMGGSALGVAAGVSSEAIDAVISTFVNTLLAFPGLLFSLILLTLLGRGELSVVIAVGVAQVAPTARVIRSAVKTVVVSGYVEAAYSLGGTPRFIIRRHILPNIRRTLLAYAAISFSYAIMNSAGLNLLGLGVAPGVPEWGSMLAEGRSSFRLVPWSVIAPGLAISIVILATNTLAAQIGKSPADHGA